MKQRDDGRPLSQFFTHKEERPAFDRLGTQAAQEAVRIEAVGQKLCDAMEGGERGGLRLNLRVVGDVGEVCEERTCGCNGGCGRRECGGRSRDSGGFGGGRV
eukprot:10242739-Ditylum_brightwellii.AAC.1